MQYLKHRSLWMGLFALSLFLTSIAEAGITYINRTNGRIVVGVVTTFGSHIYEDDWKYIETGNSYRIGSGRFNIADTYWVVVLEEANGWAAKTWTGTTYPRAFCSPSQAYFHQSGHDGQLGTNKFVADEMRLGNWEPFKSHFRSLGAGTQYPVLRIDPRGTYDRAFLSIVPGGYEMTIK